MSKIKWALALLFLVIAGSIFYSKSEKVDICCIEKSLTAVYAQNPPKPKEPEEEPQGNPNHTEPTQNCGTNPQEGSKMIKCSCHKWRKCETDQEPISCTSYCWKHFCKCAKPPCV